MSSVSAVSENQNCPVAPKYLVGAVVSLVTGVALIVLGATIQGLPPYGMGLMMAGGALFVLGAVAITILGKRGGAASVTTRPITQTVGSSWAGDLEEEKVKSIFTEAQQFIDDLLKKDFISLKIIVTVKTKEYSALTLPYIIKSTPTNRNLLADFMKDAVRGSELASTNDEIHFTVLTKRPDNQFDFYHCSGTLLRAGAQFSKGLAATAQDPQENRDFATVFDLYGLTIEPQIDDAGNFI